MLRLGVCLWVGFANKHQYADPPHVTLLLLRTRPKRPRSRAAEQRKDLAPSYVEHGLLPGTRCASLQQPQHVPEAPRRSLG